jgi:hypothetical protein
MDNHSLPSAETTTKAYPKLCVTCVNCSFSPFSPKYSEHTPGSPTEMSCSKPLYKLDKAGRRRYVKYSRWDMQDANSLSEMRDMLLMAETCPDYQLYTER